MAYHTLGGSALGQVKATVQHLNDAVTATSPALTNGHDNSRSEEVHTCVTVDTTAQTDITYKDISNIYPALSLHPEDVSITTTDIVQRIDEMFIGVTIDTSRLRAQNHTFNLSSPMLVDLTKALTPLYLRVGGTAGDFMTFDPHAKDIHVMGLNFTLIPSTWDELNSFVNSSGVKLIFGLNVQIRKNGSWDPSNAKQLMTYSSMKRYPIAGFELGNEPNYFQKKGLVPVSGAQLASDFNILNQVLQNTSYKSSLILGPDTAGYNEHYIENFLSNGGSNAVDIVTFHHYYFNGERAKMADFTDPIVLDQLKSTIETAVSTIHNTQASKPIWLGETSSAFAGGATNMSDRYVSGVLWLDKLGLSARYGIKGLMRQTLFGGLNGLIADDDKTPRPTYWIALLYKRLVGYEVFDVTTSSRNIRVYAHCTKESNLYNYQPGSLTVYAINLYNDSITLQFPHLQVHPLHLFWLTPDGGDLHAKDVLLNEKPLVLVNGTQIPQMDPKIVTSGSVTVPAMTYGFVVVPDADVDECKTDVKGTITG